MSNSYVPVTIDPLGPETSFTGELTRASAGGAEFTTLRSSGQRVRRTRQHIAQSSAEVLYVGICLSGTGRIAQDGRVAELRPGEMVFVDSRRPNWWESDGVHEQIVIQVPTQELAERGGWVESSTPAAITMTPDSAAGPVIEFFRNVTTLQRTAPAQAAELAAHSMPLLASTLALTSGQLPGELGERAHARLRVRDVLRRRCGDPTLTVDDIARECLLSRRALYRLFEDGEPGVMERLWSIRVERAKSLFAAYPDRTVAAVAAESGFATERQFYRAFRAKTGITPGEHRARLHQIPAG
ncbi:helix-turn-helix domain-containing protein [Nocardia sp. NPDC058658]|uniref:AraC-like ligand-binding domain-containing protein n=1 Tax=Nocardia sp. NPDC058658 TaxID=3346580 RepID=UPI00366325A1